jgi:hypothetical protein
MTKKALQATLPFLALLLAAPVGGSIEATVLVPMTLEQVASRAHWAGVGVCTGVRSRWEGKKIVTEVTFDVERAVKGEARSRLKLQLLGGSVSAPVPVSMQVPGSPVFREGETDLLFLERGADGADRVVGFSQGRVRLRREAGGGLTTEAGEDLERLLRRLEPHMKAPARP